MTEKELMKKLAQGMFDRIPDLNDIPPAQEEFSEEHKAKMEKLFAKPQWYMVFYRIPRRVLIAVLTFIIIVAVPLSVKAIREPLFSFIGSVRRRTDGVFLLGQGQRKRGEQKNQYIFQIVLCSRGL